MVSLIGNGRLLLLLCTFLCFFVVDADPEFCNRGFKMASRFHDCWLQAMFANKFVYSDEERPTLDSHYMEAYATHMCSVVKPQALKCLRTDIEACDNIEKLMDMADDSGGACRGNNLNPFFKTHVIDRLVPLEGDYSQCFDVAERTYECYQAAGQKIMQMGGQSDDVVTFHRVADKFFGAYWRCSVQIFKTNERLCPNWQIPMLLTLQKTAMPSLFGLRLRPEQVEQLGLSPVGDGNSTDEGLNQGPSKLYLLVQLLKTKPDVSDLENSIVMELSDLNYDPQLQSEHAGEGETQGQNVDPRTLSLRELKKLLRAQRKSYNEVKEFVRRAKERQESAPADEGDSYSQEEPETEMEEKVKETKKAY